MHWQYNLNHWAMMLDYTTCLWHCVTNSICRLGQARLYSFEIMYDFTVYIIRLSNCLTFTGPVYLLWPAKQLYIILNVFIRSYAQYSETPKPWKIGKAIFWNLEESGNCRNFDRQITGVPESNAKFLHLTGYMDCKNNLLHVTETF